MVVLFVNTLKEDLDAWLRNAPYGDLEHSSTDLSDEIVTTVSQTILDGDELRLKCAALSESHRVALSKLVTNLHGLVEEIHVSTRLKESRGEYFDWSHKTDEP